MKILRTSRIERRLQRTANRQQGAPTAQPKRFFKQARGKTDPQTLLQAVKLNKMKLRWLTSDLHNVIYSDGIDEADYQSRLFDPYLYDLRSLPPALLDAKEELLPLGLVPQTRDELRKLLERLMVLNGKANDYDVLVQGWRGNLSSRDALDQHVEYLWRLKAKESWLYEGLVSGRFAPVIRHCQELDESPKRSRLRDMLIRQTLIWCCHDVQMLVARLTKPVAFGALGTNSRAKQSPERELNNQRDRYVALEETLTLFFGSEDWRNRDVDLAGLKAGLEMQQPEHKWISRIARQLNRAPDATTGIDLDQVTALMRVVAARLRNRNKSFARMATPRTTNAEPKTFPAQWYHVTSPMMAVAIAVRRLIQAEQEMPALVDELIKKRELGDPPVVLQTTLSSYADHKRTHGSRTRIENVVRFYSAALFRGSAHKVATGNWDHMKESKCFLEEMGARRHDDHEGKSNDRRRSFYLLDVIPEHRFSASGPEKLLEGSGTSA